MIKKTYSYLAAIFIVPLTLCASEVYSLEAIQTTVTVDTIDNSGISDGFLYKNVTLGALGQKKAIDVPYQINSISQDMMENQQAQGLQDVIKYIPSAQIESRAGAELGRPQTRGMRGEVVANSYWDGFNTVDTTAIPMEMFEDMQVISGLAGTLYGPQFPSGIFNFVLKRPTQTFYNSITTSYMNDGNIGIHGDFGGREGMVGYRVNVLKQNGEGYVNNSNLNRELISTALDFYLSDRLTLETNFSRYNYTKTGFTGIFSMPNTAGGVAKYTLPDAVSSDQEGFGQTRAGMDLKTTTASAKVKYDIGNDWYFEGGYQFQRADRDVYVATNQFTNNVGGYKSTIDQATGAYRFDINSWFTQLNKKTELTGMEHELSGAITGYDMSNYNNKRTASSVILGTSNIYNPTAYSDPVGFTDIIEGYKSAYYDTKHLTLGDTIHLNKEWQVMLSFSESSIDQDSFNKTGVQKADYSKNGESYAASLIYKPLDNLSFYTTYADSIQIGSSGTNADGTTVMLAPSRSKQYEIGAKTTVYDIDFSTALFQITRPIAYQGGDGIYSERGEQRNRGIEFMSSGKLSENLILYGGITLLDPVLKDTKVASLDGKQVIGMPEVQYNILLDYAMPISYGILGFSTNFHFADKRAIDEANSQWADSYYTIDLGTRFVTKKLWGDKTIFKITVNNVTNEKYWDSMFANTGLDGLGSTGATNIFLGEPRRVIASVQIKF